MDTSQRSDDQSQGVAPVQPSAPPATVVPQQPVDQTQQTPVQAPQSVIPGGKEAAPVPTGVAEVQGVIQPSAHETVPQLNQEVEQAGVEVPLEQHSIQLTQEHKEAGIEAVGASIPVPMNPQAVVTSPWPLPKAEEAAGGKADNSATWLGKLIVFVFGQQPYKKDAA